MMQKMVLLWAGTAGVAVLAKLLLKGGTRSLPQQRDPIEGILIQFDLTPSEILHQADDVILLSKNVHDRVGAVPLDEVSYESVIAPLANLEAEEFPRIQGCTFLRLVGVSEAVREASAEAEQRIDAHKSKCAMREDVYRVVKAFAGKEEALGPEAERYVSRLITEFERLGLNLSKEARSEIEFLNSNIRAHCLEFQHNLDEENQLLYFAEYELAGLPRDYIQSLRKRKDGKLEVSLEYPHYLPIMERCKVGATRRAVGTAYDQRCMSKNVAILEKVVALRHAVAKILGYENHAEYATAIRMAKTPDNVVDFLESMSSRMSGLARAELRKLKALKKEEEGVDGFEMADMRYYIRKAEQAEFKVDFDKVKEYFPIEVVTRGILKIYQDLLGLRFKLHEKPNAWHSDVRMFAVVDVETGERMGFFYLDLYPRIGKYSRACVCCLQAGCVQESGTRQLPVAAMLTNFPKPTIEKPSLLTHTEVTTYFHEFGHVMHHICGRTSFARFTGLRAEDDFVEACSQMLENLCFEAPALKLMSGYYKDTSKSIPAYFCQALSKKRRSYAGLLTKRQLLFGLFDQAIHSTDNVDTAVLIQKLHPQVMEGIQMAEGTHFGASFTHLCGGYDAAYYGYLWSEVFSADMFAGKFRRDILSRSAGRQYRERVLTPAACKDGIEILEDFLERAPSAEAFLRSKGVY